jgi:hypothetical protein
MSCHWWLPMPRCCCGIEVRCPLLPHREDRAERDPQKEGGESRTMPEKTSELLQLSPKLQKIGRKRWQRSIRLRWRERGL